MGAKNIATSSLLFAMFAIDVFKSMLHDFKTPLSFIILGFMILNVHNFFGSAPDWARAAFSFFIFSQIAKTIPAWEPIDREVLSLKKKLWLSSLSSNKGVSR